MFLAPLDKSEELIRGIAASPAESAGLNRCPIQPLLTKHYTRPLFKLPASEIIVSHWMFRSVPEADAQAYASVTDTNRAILDRVKLAGGKGYPPYAPYFTRGDWQAHYGDETWRRLVAAKQEYDPRGVLTPGPGVFAT